LAAAAAVVVVRVVLEVLAAASETQFKYPAAVFRDKVMMVRSGLPRRM